MRWIAKNSLFSGLILMVGLLGLLLGLLAFLRREPSTAYLLAIRNHRTGKESISLVRPDGQAVDIFYLPDESPTLQFSGYYFSLHYDDKLGQVFYVGHTDDTFSIYKLDLKTGKNTPVFVAPGYIIRLVDYLPQNDWLIFSMAPGENTDNNIYRIHSDGSGILDLANQPGSKGQCYMCRPLYDSNGTWLVFVSDTSYRIHETLREIYKVSIDNGKSIKLTNENEVSSSDALISGRDYGLLAITPDTKWLFFSNYVGNYRGHYEIFRIALDEVGPPKSLTEPDDSVFQALSPDGSRILFMSERSGKNQFYSMNIDGSTVEALTFMPHDSYRGSFSPDGQWIIYESGGALHYVHTDGSDHHQVATHYDSEFLVALENRLMLSPDKRWFYYMTYDHLYKVRVKTGQSSRFSDSPYPDEGYVEGFQTGYELPWHPERFIMATGGFLVMLTYKAALSQRSLRKLRK